MIWLRTAGLALAILMSAGCGGWWSQEADRSSGQEPQDRMAQDGEAKAALAQPVEAIPAAVATTDGEVVGVQKEDQRKAESLERETAKAEQAVSQGRPASTQPQRTTSTGPVPGSTPESAPPLRPRNRQEAVAVRPERAPGNPAEAASSDSSAGRPPEEIFATAESALPPAPDRQGVVVPPGPPRPGGNSGSAGTPVVSAVPDSPSAEPVRLPEGTVLEVRLADTLSTKTHHAADTFRAILDRDLETDQGIVIPRGTEVEGTILEAREPGRFKGRASLTFALTRIMLLGEPMAVETNQITMEAEGSSGDDLKRVGIGAAVGTALGAILGGKKGAAIGGATGAGAGTAGVLVSRGNHVEIEKERLFSFRLEKEAFQERR